MDTDSIKQLLDQENPPPPPTFTPLPSNLASSPPSKKHNGKKIFLSTLALVLFIVLGGIIYNIVQLTLTQKQATQTEAEAPACHNNNIPAPADPHCYNCRTAQDSSKNGKRAFAEKEGRTGCEPGAFKVESPARHEHACSWCPQDAPTALVGRNDTWASCPAPMDGFCKAKTTSCFECRSVPNIPFMYCRCGEAAPTSPPQPTLPPPIPTTPPRPTPTTPPRPTPTTPPQPTPTTPVVPTPTTPVVPTITPRPTTTPVPSICPVPGRVINVEVTCPICE